MLSQFSLQRTLCCVAFAIMSAFPLRGHADTYHAVEPGDTLNSIASRYHLTPEAIRAANRLNDTRDSAPLPTILLLIPEVSRTATKSLSPSVPIPNQDVNSTTVNAPTGKTNEAPRRILSGTPGSGIIVQMTSYVVKQGDTLESIAQKFSKPGQVITASDIRRRNYMSSEPAPGVMLLIPTTQAAFESPADSPGLPMIVPNPEAQEPSAHGSNPTAAQPASTAKKPETPKKFAAVARVAKPGGVMRRLPDAKATALYSCAVGMEVAVIKEQGIWSAVIMSDRSTGWIPTKYLQPTPVLVEISKSVIITERSAPRIKITLPSDYGARKVSPFYANSPIVITSKQLPPGFLGQNPAAVFWGIERKKTTKGKYETSAEFGIRANRIWSAPLFGKVCLWSPIAFSLSPSWCDYDADQQNFQAHFAGFSKSRTGDWENQTQYLHFATHSWTQDQGSYIGQNAFGATVKVARWQEFVYGFQITNPTDFGFVPTTEGGDKYRISLAAQIDPKTAPKVERNIKALFIGYVTKPYQSQDLGFDAATFDSPYSTSKTSNYVCFRLKAVWFYDLNSGRIYAKITPGNPEGSTPKNP